MRPDFDTLADAYATHRTGYSEALFARVLAAAATSPRVLDLGAGTGLSTRAFLPHARRIVAVDVARRMLAVLEGAPRVVARAEALPFDDAAFDLLVCAQAFHWMDARVALAEMRRVLREGGVAAIWWKYPAEDDAVMRATDEAFVRATGRTPLHTPLARGPLPLPTDVPFARVERARFEHEQTYTLDAWLGYQASREMLRKGAGEARDAALVEMRRALAAQHGDALLVVRYVEHLTLLHA